MSHVQKMAITCSLDCIQQAGILQPDAIIVGTSMGCCVNTKNFLKKIIDTTDGPLSPTSFIVSTHNTVAGQIALLLKNHCYNMTYTQNSLSFEHAITDAMMFIDNGEQNILVGGADEEESSIYNMHARLNNDNLRLTSGSSFFILSSQRIANRSIKLIDATNFGLINNSSEKLKSFCTKMTLKKMK